MKAATRLGDVLNETYELRELLSSSKQHEVYLGTDKHTSTAVHVTLLRPEFALQSRVVDSFLNGPRHLSSIVHAGLPRVRVDSDDVGIPFVVVEAIEGRSLAALIGSFPQGLPLELVQALSLPLVEALALAHEHGVVHGSIDAEHVRLLGAAHAPSPKWIGLGSTDAVNARQDPHYQAPELNDESVRPTTRTDVFSLGVLVYAMLTGELPFRSGRETAVPLDEIAPSAPRAWVDLTNACLELTSKKRAPDARAVLIRLRACLPPPEPKRELEQTALRKPRARVTEPAPARSDRVPRAAAAATAVSTSANATSIPVTQPSAAPRRSSPRPVRPRPSEQPPESHAKKAVAQQAVEKLSAKHRPASTSQNPARAVAVALTDAQLDALRAMRLKDEDEDRDRWIAVFFWLIFLVLLHFAVPLLSEPNLAAARTMLGPNLRILASGFSIVVGIAAVRVWVAQVHDRTLVHRITTLVCFALAAGVFVIISTLYSSSFSLGAAARVAGRLLPWGAGLFYFLLAIQLARHGLRRATANLAYGLVAFLMAGASLYGSYGAVVAGVSAQRSRGVAPIVDKSAFERLQNRQPADGPIRERTEIGANEEEDLRSLEDLEKARKNDQHALDNLQKDVQRSQP